MKTQEESLKDLLVKTSLLHELILNNHKRINLICESIEIDKELSIKFKLIENKK